MRIYGFSAHFYDSKANSDKFYRAFIWFDGTRWSMGKHWGRDGRVGTTDIIRGFPSEVAAQKALDLKLRDELKKGYELLGQGFAELPVQDAVDVHQASARLHNWVGREPTKLPDGYAFIIREEPDLEDLLA